MLGRKNAKLDRRDTGLGGKNIMLVVVVKLVPI